MEEIFIKLNKLRLLRNVLFLGVFLFCLVGIIINQLFVQEHWLYALIVFDDLLLFVVLLFLIETKVGMRYEELYHHEFLPLVFETINPEYKYCNHPQQFNANLIHTKIFDYDSKIRVNDYVKISDGELYHAQIYINTYRSNKIVQFTGYIFVLSNPDIENKGLILYHKKPFLSSLKELKTESFSKYRIFNEIDNHFNKTLLDKLKIVLSKYLDYGHKFYICIQDDIIILKPNKRSIFNKPLLKPINQAYFNNKIDQYLQLNQMMEEISLCFKTK